MENVIHHHRKQITATPSDTCSYNSHICNVTIITFISALVLFLSNSVYSKDIVKIHTPAHTNGEPHTYHQDVLRAALIATEDDFGPYELIYTHAPSSRKRALQETIDGRERNIMPTPPTKEWDEQAIRIQFPITKGFLSYRVYLLLNKNIPTLEKVHTLDELKAISTGSMHQWNLTEIYRHHKFKHVCGHVENTLATMLQQERFTTFSRGLNEVFLEYDRLKSSIPELTVDKNVLLYVYMPLYFYVSPQQNTLAKRIKEGLVRIHNNGQLDILFEQHHADVINKAKLDERKVFVISNPYIPEEIFEQDKPYIYRIPGLNF